MSPVDQAGSVSENSPCHFFLYKSFSMCSDEKAGWPGYQDLGFCNQDLSNQAGNFSHMNTPAQKLGLFVTKHFQLRMACKVADKLERSSMGILGAFWTFFISLTGI